MILPELQEHFRTVLNVCTMDPLQELCLACRLGNMDSVDGILCGHKGINLNKSGKDGMTPLQEACSSGSLEVVKRLIEEGAHVTHITEMRGFQALHTAVYNRRQPVVEFLIKEGKCHVDTPTSHQEVPLHLACLRGDVSMVTFLLGCNAECACQDTNGNTCLHYAAAGNCADVVRCIVSRHGEMKDLKNKFGQTAAHRAAMLGCYRALEALVLSRVDLLVKDNDGHTPHDLANLFQNTKCSSVAKPGAVPPGAVLSFAVSSNSYLKVQTVPYGRSSSGSEGDRISGGGSPKPGAMIRRPSWTGTSRPRSINLPFGLLSKKPVYVSGELAENVSRSGSIDWQNVCIEPPPDVHFIHPKHQTSLNRTNRQLISTEHGIKLKLGGSYWKPPREGAEVEVWLCAGMQSSYTCPRGHFVVSPICFVSCKTVGPCHVTLILPTAVRMEEKDTSLLTVLSAVPSNTSLRLLDSPQSAGAGTLIPLANCGPRPLPKGGVRFTCVLTSASLFAVAVCVGEFPSPSYPLRCCVTVGYEVQKECSLVKGFDLVAYVGMRLPSITTAVGAEIELAGSVHEEKLFDLKTKNIVLDVSVNRPQEWEITARDSEEIDSTSLCISNDTDEGFSFTHVYPPRRRFFLDPRVPRASLTCAVRVVSVACGREELCKVVVTPYNPLRETTPDLGYALPKVSSSLSNPAMVGSRPPLFRISSEEGTSLLAVPVSSSQHGEHRRGSLSPSSSHSSFGNREASPSEEGSKLLESIGSNGVTRLSAPCHVSTREASPSEEGSKLLESIGSDGVTRLSAPCHVSTREASPSEEGSKLLESIGSDGVTRLSAPCHVSTREASPSEEGSKLLESIGSDGVARLSAPCHMSTREASPSEEGSKLLESIGSDGVARLSAPCHVSTRETSPNDSDVSRQSDAPLIKPSRVTDV